MPKIDMISSIKRREKRHVIFSLELVKQQRFDENSTDFNYKMEPFWRKKNTNSNAKECVPEFSRPEWEPNDDLTKKKKMNKNEQNSTLNSVINDVSSEKWRKLTKIHVGFTKKMKKNERNSTLTVSEKTPFCRDFD